MRSGVAAVVLFALVILVGGSLFVVREGESALVVRLGEVTRDPIVEPGLRMKWPLLDDVLRFDARILEWDGDPERIPVRDSKFIFVDTFARWRISDPALFYNAVRDENGAQSRLDDVLDGSVREVVSNHYLIELVRSTERTLLTPTGNAQDESEVLLAEAISSTGGGEYSPDFDAKGQRLEVRKEIYEISRKKLEGLKLGIELVDLRIKRIDYTEEVESDVFNRMISEQQRIAERYRAQGQGKKAEIAGLTTQEQQQIESESYRRAQEILGEADAQSTRIYAQAYNRDPELYRFLKTLESYRKILGADDTLILSTDSELLRFLESSK